jgi:hypothetical protein
MRLICLGSLTYREAPDGHESEQRGVVDADTEDGRGRVSVQVLVQGIGRKEAVQHVDCKEQHLRWHAQALVRLNHLAHQPGSGAAAEERRLLRDVGGIDGKLGLLGAEYDVHLL